MMDPDTLQTYADDIGAHFSWDVAYWRAFCAEWARGENTEARNNPLACTAKMPTSTTFNSDGVQEYATLEDGVLAAIWELDPASHYEHFTDWYPNVRVAIANSSIDAGGRSTVSAQIRKWGTIAFADEIDAGWDVHLGSVVLPPAKATVDSLNAAVDAINAAALTRFGNQAAAAGVLSTAVTAAFGIGTPQAVAFEAFARAMLAAASPSLF